MSAKKPAIAKKFEAKIGTPKASTPTATATATPEAKATVTNTPISAKVQK